MTIDNSLINDHMSAEIKNEEDRIKQEQLLNPNIKTPPPQMVQGILCNYLVNQDGGLMKKIEIDVKMSRKL